MKLVVKILMLCIAVFSLSMAAAAAANFTVTTTGDTADFSPGNGVCMDSVGACSFRAAIDEANALAGDDTITLPAGTYTQSLAAADEDNNAGGDWDIRSNITINGAGSGSTFLQAHASPDTATERVLESVGTNVVVIDAVTIRHGKKTGVFVTDTTSGGGIRNGDGTMTIGNSAVTLNKSTSGGGIYNSGNITLNNVQVTSNTCRADTSCIGGGMHNKLNSTKNVTITGSNISNNAADPAIGFSGLKVSFGCGFGVTGAGVNLNISGSSFNTNQGVGFTADPPFGGGRGCGIYLIPTGPSTINMSDTSVSGNSLSGGYTMNGMGIYLSAGANTTGTWDKITVANNTTNAPSTYGAGIHLASAGASTELAFDIRNSTISGNTTPANPPFAEGGGVVIINGGAGPVQANFLNTTISGNNATRGGGVYLDAGSGGGTAAASFDYCTISGNAARDFGGGLIGGGGNGTINLRNTIVADNTSPIGPDISGSVVSQNYNHIENTAGTTIAPMANDTSGFDPQLGPLQNNGGPTLTRLLANSSPLINSVPGGVNGCGTTVVTDQRGFTRPAMSRCDAGATEVQSFPGGPFTVSGSVTTPGGIPLRNIVVQLEGGGLSGPRYTVTGSFGTYLFTDVAAEGYMVRIPEIRKYTFAVNLQVVNVYADRPDINFTGVPAVPHGGGKAAITVNVKKER